MGACVCGLRGFRERSVLSVRRPQRALARVLSSPRLLTRARTCPLAPSSSSSSSPSQGAEDRGWVLKATEEISVLLEDMGLNLQSMMASPFVRPFLTEVRAWEQKLSLIGECIEVRQSRFRRACPTDRPTPAPSSPPGLRQPEPPNLNPERPAAHLLSPQVWMLVQRKWMYLESIFVGSDDIRHQLPQEAKRFDGIDKKWHKIMSDTAKNTNVLDACSTDGRCARGFRGGSRSPEGARVKRGGGECSAALSGGAPWR